MAAHVLNNIPVHFANCGIPVEQTVFHISGITEDTFFRNYKIIEKIIHDPKC